MARLAAAAAGGRWTRRRPGAALDVIERSVHQQSRLISDLLDVSRIVAGKLTLQMEPVDLPALVGGVVESSRPTFDAKSVTLTSSVAADAGTVRGDPERLRQWSKTCCPTR